MTTRMRTVVMIQTFLHLRTTTLAKTLVSALSVRLALPKGDVFGAPCRSVIGVKWRMERSVPISCFSAPSAGSGPQRACLSDDAPGAVASFATNIEIMIVTETKAKTSVPATMSGGKLRREAMPRSAKRDSGVKLRRQTLCAFHTRKTKKWKTKRCAEPGFVPRQLPHRPAGISSKERRGLQKKRLTKKRGGQGGDRRRARPLFLVTLQHK